MPPSPERSPETAHRPPIPPLMGLAIGLLATSTASLFIRYAQQSAPSLVIAALRLSFATLILAPLVVSTRGEELKRLGRRELLLAVAAGAFLAIHFATWITSLEYTTVASSVVLVSTAPLWVALLTPLLLKETLAGRVWIGLGLALVGGVIVGLSDTCNLSGQGLACPPLADFVRGRAFTGDLLALAGAFGAGLYLIAGRRLRGGMSLLSYIFLVYGMAAVGLTAVMLATGYSPFGWPLQTYLWCLLLAIIPQLLGHSAYNWALRYLSAAFVSITLLGEPVASASLAYILFDETPPGLMILGAILILSGIAVASQSASSGPTPSQTHSSST